MGSTLVGGEGGVLMVTSSTVTCSANGLVRNDTSLAGDEVRRNRLPGW